MWTFRIIVYVSLCVCNFSNFRFLRQMINFGYLITSVRFHLILKVSGSCIFLLRLAWRSESTCWATSRCSDAMRAVCVWTQLSPSSLAKQQQERHRPINNPETVLSGRNPLTKHCPAELTLARLAHGRSSTMEEDLGVPPLYTNYRSHG